VADTSRNGTVLNSRSFQYRQLKQEADADKALYDGIGQEDSGGDINAGFQDNNISIADPARPPLHPIYPNMTPISCWHFLFDILRRRFNPLDLSTPHSAIHWRPAGSWASMLSEPCPLTAPRLSCQGRLFQHCRRPLSPRSFPAPIPKVTMALPPVLRRPFAPFATPFCSPISKDVFVQSLSPALHLPRARQPSPRTWGSPMRSWQENIISGLRLAPPQPAFKIRVHAARGPFQCAHRRPGLAERHSFHRGKPNLSLLPAGPGSHRAADLIGPRLSSLLDEFNKEYDLVISIRRPCWALPSVSRLLLQPMDTHCQPGRGN